MKREGGNQRRNVRCRKGRRASHLDPSAEAPGNNEEGRVGCKGLKEGGIGALSPLKR